MDTIALQESWGWLLPLCAAAYLLGSISSAILVCRLFGYPDPRTQGSSNPGATNVLRQVGKGPALVVFVLDVLKGSAAVVFARAVLGPDAHSWLVAAGLAALAGHITTPLSYWQPLALLSSCAALPARESVW